MQNTQPSSSPFPKECKSLKEKDPPLGKEHPHQPGLLPALQEGARLQGRGGYGCAICSAQDPRTDSVGSGDQGLNSSGQRVINSGAELLFLQTGSASVILQRDRGRVWE